MVCVLGYVDRSSELRDSLINDLTGRLSKIASDTGKSIMYTPEPELCKWNDAVPDAYFDAIKKSTRDDDTNVAIIACSPTFCSLFDSRAEWLQCGAFLVIGGLVHKLTVNNMDFEVASSRVLMNRGRDEVAECSVCCDRPMSFACRKCWTSVCRACFAACTLHSSDHTRWTCPQCRAKGPIGDVVAVMAHTKKHIKSKRAFTAIHNAMVELGSRSTRVTVEASMVPYGDNELQLYRRSFQVRADSCGFITVDSDESRFLARLMHERGANIIVGNIGCGHECCSAEEKGRAFYVDDDGGLVERIDMFECMATYVRSWYHK